MGSNLDRHPHEGYVDWENSYMCMDKNFLPPFYISIFKSSLTRLFLSIFHIQN